MSKSLYKESHCDKIIEYGKKGYSVSRVCRELGISRTTYYKWCERYNNFKEAEHLRSTYEEAFLDDVEEEATFCKRKVNTQLFLERRRRTSGAGNNPNNPQQITIGNINIANITNDQLDYKIKELVDTLKDEYHEDVTALIEGEVIEQSDN